MHAVLRAEGYDAGISPRGNLSQLVDATREPLFGGFGTNCGDRGELEKVSHDDHPLVGQTGGGQDCRGDAHTGFFDDHGVESLIFKESGRVASGEGCGDNRCVVE